jgi:aspartate aminotransferase-like enzyme
LANHPSIAPFALDAAVAEIRAKKPCVVFAPHVETSAGIILSHEYIRALAKATHESRDDAIFVLDCIASGNVWTPMKQLGVDVIVTAPQKGWTSPSCAAVVMLSEHARAVMDKQNAASQQAVGRPRGHSFACNLAKWTAVADAYKPEGGFMCDTRPSGSVMRMRAARTMALLPSRPPASCYALLVLDRDACRPWIGGR